MLKMLFCYSLHALLSFILRQSRITDDLYFTEKIFCVSRRFNYVEYLYSKGEEANFGLHDKHMWVVNVWCLHIIMIKRWLINLSCRKTIRSLKWFLYKRKQSLRISINTRNRFIHQSTLTHCQYIFFATSAIACSSLNSESLVV